MIPRLLRSAAAFASLVVAYLVYVNTVAPIVEPSVKRSQKTVTPVDVEGSYQAFSRYGDLLASYFPEGHWTLSDPLPMVVLRDRMMLVLKGYRNNDDGSMDLDECAALLLPSDWEFGSPAPRDAVIIEAPGGAHLKFDDDFNPASGKIGKIVGGRFPGVITIRSDMETPGPADDLLIKTRDLVIADEGLVRTDALVEARLGPHHGSGRKLAIRLNRDLHKKQGLSINGVKSLTIQEDVNFVFDAGETDLFGQEKAQDKLAMRTVYPSPRPIRLTSATTPMAESNLVEVKCGGRFFFDMLNYVATLDNTVVVTRQRLDGPYDQLDCHELSVKFSPVDKDGVPIESDDPNVARRQREAVGSMKPILVTATGHPVKAQSDVENAELRANRVRINLYSRRITLDDSSEVMLRYGSSEGLAPLIEYQMPEESSPRAVGELSMAGPGRLRAVPDATRPDRIIDISWQAAADTRFPVQLTRRDGQPVLVLSGQPVVDAHRLGKITSARMEVELREVPADGPDGPAFEVSKSKHKLAIVPERLMASGDVVFASPKLSGRTHLLEGNFEPWQSASPGQVSEASNGMRLDGSNDKPAGKRYDLWANQINLDLALAGKSAEPTNVMCDGSVVFRELDAKPGEEPLVVRGQRMSVRDVDTDAKITVTGRRDPQLGGPGTATITARGMTLAAERLDADQSTGRFWSNGPGMATMNVDGELFGQLSGTTTPVTLTWQTGLDAAGQRIVASGRALVESQHGWVQADQLVALLTKPLSVGRDAADGKVELARVSLEGNVVGDYRGQDDQGQISHENFQVEQIAYDHLTGNIQGRGPGVLRSVRLSTGSLGFADLAGAPGHRPHPEQPSKKEEPHLQYARLDFNDGISGNVNQRIVRFHGRVRGVYGPVDDWKDELPLYAPGRLPSDTVTLSCETLEVNEDPLARPAKKNKLGPLEVRALTNVDIEGRSAKSGVFQAQAMMASYSQAKDLFVLEGDGRQDAMIRTRDYQGREGKGGGQRLEYYRTSGEFNGINVSPIELQQTTPRSAQPTRSPRNGPIR
ncbi:hypothetical protein NG895_19525 [Aeoliella sp. ICT_H6.2]|uniref:OstA-like protein n=1 Tax=Aeoliella straminimaris TaxID=2954799 RepID=A0A9X2FIK4_9BACT|nr:hypothetical protein [Aeoliella straminimaris]MCO6046096.1 hypothetical protein [Aeoliella straminimaris]